MRIPSGDLAPARRGRRYGAYGSRRRQVRRTVLALVLVAVVVGGVGLLRADDAAAPDRLGAPSACPTPSPTPSAALPAPAQVSLRVLNGTDRDGLSTGIGGQLQARGFRVTDRSNAPKALAGGSRVYFGPGARAAATLVALQVVGARLAPVGDAPAGAIDLVLGSSFTRLRTDAEIAELARDVLTGRVDLEGPDELVAPAPSPSASGACG